MQPSIRSGDPSRKPSTNCELPRGEVEHGALSDLSADPVGLAQEDAGGRLSVEDGVDVHDRNMHRKMCILNLMK
jgi:hypothetical protein